MKAEKEHKIGLFDIDFQSELRVQAAARLFQEASSFHSTQVGAGTDQMFERGLTWFLNRIEIEFLRYPVLNEEVLLRTWSRGFKRFKGFREYVMTSNKGDIARASSVYICFDFKRNRISKIPQEILDCYANHSDKLFAHEIDEWKTCGRIQPENRMDITLRYSDFDVNGHVNNTLYLGFLETVYHHRFNASSHIRNIKIRFNKEIDKTVKMVSAGFKKTNGIYQFNISDDSNLYADGEIISME